MFSSEISSLQTVLSVPSSWVLSHSKLTFAYQQELTSSSGSFDGLRSVDETSSADFEATYQPKTDLLKTIAVFTAALTGTLAINLSWVTDNQVNL